MRSIEGLSLQTTAQDVAFSHPSASPTRAFLLKKNRWHPALVFSGATQGHGTLRLRPTVCKTAGYSGKTQVVPQ